MKILIPIFASMFFLLGHFITKIFKEKEKMFLFSIGIAFVTLLGIIIFDLIPEVLEIYENFPNKHIIIFGMFLIGFIFFVVLDSHSHHHREKDHNKHLFHIGITTTIVLVIHNLVEGIFIYFSAVSSIKTGLLLALAVGLHNIPFGMQISSNLELSKTKFRNKFLIFSFLIISTIIGGLIGMYFESIINIYVLGAVLAITVGMTVYIAIFELLREILFHKNKKQSVFGIICGIILLIITSLI